MRAYHRVDPLMDERKGHYSPAQLGAFVKVQLVAGRQQHRGRFRSVAMIRNLLPATYARHLDFLFAEGDLVVGLDGAVYVDGWDEWQEGDLTVKDRMARLRNRKRNNVTGHTVTPTVTQPSPTAIRSSVGVGVGIGGAIAPDARDGLPHIDDEARRFLEGITGRSLSMAGDKQLTEYDRQIEDHGLGPVIAAYQKVAKTLPNRPTARQLVWSAMRVLEPFANPKNAERQDREDEEQRAHQKRLEATRSRLQGMRDTA